MNLALRYAARSDVGLVRADNQDSGYAGPDLLAVADGMGGHAGGDIASTLAIRSLAPLDGHQHVPDGALGELEQAIESAKQAIVERSEAEPQLAGMGTTVTAILRAGSQLVMAHLGDSRAYLLRDDELTQVTTDHTFVQHLVDTGRIAPEDAEHHPQRNVVMRVLGDFEVDLTPDLSVREARPGDRWLLCSDGLSGFVAPDMIAQILISVVEPGECADTLIQLALRAGSTDNVTAVVADVVDLDADPDHPVEGAVPHPADALADEPLPTHPEVVGSALRDDLVPGLPPLATSNEADDADDAATDDPEADAAAAAGAEPHPGRGRRRALGATITLVLVLVILGGGYAAYGWTQNQYFVGESQGQVAVFQGVPQNIGPLHLSSPVELTDTAVDTLPSYVQDRLSATIPATSLSDARARAAAVTTGTATPAPTPTPSPTVTPATPATTAPAATPTTTTAPTKPSVQTTHGPATAGKDS